MTDLKIISISGKPGLYNLLTTTKSGIVAQSLIDKKRVMSPFANISALDEIAVYTYNEEVPLWKIFKSIAEKEDYKKSIDHKSDKKILEEYFRVVLPEYDEDRFYPSHMKKIIQWYNILQTTDVLKTFLEEKEKQYKELEKAEKEAEKE
jgi:hypothetical protein